MINVYQVKNPVFFARDKMHREELHLVARVNTSDLDTAFELTNSRNNSWWTNADVEFLGSHEHGMSGCRSTSVGDVLELDGTFHSVAGNGFCPVTIFDGALGA